VLAWARKRIDIPPAIPFPTGHTNIGDLEAFFSRQQERAIAYLDATLRAAFERRLIAEDPN
jgi:hypothetical protein